MITKEKILEAFEEKFRCINYNCNNKGSLSVPDQDGDEAEEQCQFCFEYLMPMKEYISTSIDSLLQGILSEIDKKMIVVIPERKKLGRPKKYAGQGVKVTKINYTTEITNSCLSQVKELIKSKSSSIN